MQSDVPPLPISCLTNNTHLHRNANAEPKLIEQINKNKSTCKSSRGTLLLTNKKQLRSVIAGCSPYKNTARYIPPDIAKSVNKSAIDQRISSAKMLRLKQLQNQLADAHFHLNELSNENKLLKAIQKRQDAALKRYEGTKAELPRIINTHQEDFRVLQTKYKKLRSQYKDISDTLKDKENELYSLQEQNKKLLQLSKDRHLLEREKLQTQVLDLNHRVNQQDEIIQTLKRKLELESKYLKHQLHVEMVKHKETQKKLHETQLKLKNLEELTEQREKRSYCASRIFFHKDKPSITTQSLTNLNESRFENVMKGQSFRRRRNEATKGQSLPALGGSTSVMRSQSQETPTKSSLETASTTEMFTNYEQTRHSRLQKSPALHKVAPLTTSKINVRDSPIKESKLEYSDIGANQPKSSINLENVKKTYELPKTLKEEFGYESDNDHKINDNLVDNNEEVYDPLNLTSRSRLLHTRLISSAVEMRTNKEQVANRPRSFSKENIEYMKIMNENDHDTKYDRDSVITVISRDTVKVDLEVNCNNSDAESEMEIPIAFNVDEENNVKRKSDIVIDNLEIEKQQNTSFESSTIFENFNDSSNKLFNSNKDFEDIYKSDYDTIDNKIISNKNEMSFKSVNGLLRHSELFTESVDASIDNILARKKSITKKQSTISLDDDEYERKLLEEEKDFVFNEIMADSNENDEKDMKKTESINEKSGSGLKNYNFKDKINYSSKESNLQNSIEQKTVDENSAGFDKAKLLAAMKAIDDNENIEFIEQKPRKNSGANRLQITENLYRGIPTHSKKKSDIMKELFADINPDNKNRKEN